jgi:hypothetical protein
MNSINFINYDSRIASFFSFLILGGVVIVNFDSLKYSVEITQFCISFICSIFFILPFVIHLLVRLEFSLFERFVIIFWIFLKSFFTYIYYFEIWGGLDGPFKYLAFSDHLAFHNWAIFVSNYWRTSSEFIISMDVLRSQTINYPVSAYIFGGIYYLFGHYPSVILPWLSSIQFVVAYLALFVFSLANLPVRYSKFVFYFVLWSPLVWITTLLLHRDILILLSVLIIVLGYLLVVARKSFFSGIFFILFGTFIVLNLRAEMLFSVALFFACTCFITFFKNNSLIFKLLVFVSFLFFIILFYNIIYGNFTFLYVQKYDLSSNIFLLLDKYLSKLQNSGKIYGLIMSLGGIFLVPIILPFKFFVGLLAPFPWNFSTFQLLVTQPFYSLESIIRILIFLFALYNLFISKNSYKFSNYGHHLRLFGLFLLLPALFGPKGEARYMLPSIPFLILLANDHVFKFKNWVIGSFVSVFIILMLHIFYYIIVSII